MKKVKERHWKVKEKQWKVKEKQWKVEEKAVEDQRKDSGRSKIYMCAFKYNEILCSKCMQRRSR